MQKFIETITEFFSISAYDILKVLVTLIVGLVIIKLIMKIVKKLLLVGKIDSSVINFILTIFRISLSLGLLFLCLSLLSISLTSAIAVLSAVGLALALALQDSLTNITGGITIAATKIFSIGDYVTIGDQSGTIKEIRLMYTLLFTPDNKSIVIPNKNVATSIVTNYSKNATRRIDYTIPVEYNSDIERIKTVIKKVLDDNQDVLKTQSSTIRVADIDKDGMKFTIKFWVYNSKYWTAYYDVLEGILKAFSQENIIIPSSRINVQMQKEGNK